MMMQRMPRRAVLAGLPLLFLAGCASSQGARSVGTRPTVTDDDAVRYGPIDSEPFAIAGLDLRRINPDLLRRVVAFDGSFAAGTLVVRIAERRLYLVRADGSALRYGVGVGRKEAMNFQGSGTIARKAAWPTWTPTEDMIATTPRYAAYVNGMSGGPDNPLGARALYIYRDGIDSHFRVHGTSDPRSIGKMVSSGCIRLFNHDIIDLYSRVSVGAPIVVQAS